MIENALYDPDIQKYEESIASILKRAVKLFRRTNLDDLADKWDRILKNYNSRQLTR